MRWLCQVHEPNRCWHWTSAIATGANGTSTKLFREDSDGGTHIWHKHHIASIEPVCTSSDDDGDDDVDDEDHDDDDDDLHDFMCRKPM